MSKIKTLKELAKVFAKNYDVVSLKFVKSVLEHQKQADKNAKILLREAGFVKGQKVNLKDDSNRCGYTHATCYWNRAVFNGKAPDYKTLQERANKITPEQIVEPEQITMPAEAVAPEETAAPAEAAVPRLPDLVHLRHEARKAYLRSLPPSHQRAFCLLYESVFQDLNGICTMYSKEDEGYTRHEFEAVPLSEDARRYYTPLINMFYQNKDVWHFHVVELELHGKPDIEQGWKSLLQPPYSKTLLSAYFYLTDLDNLFEEELALLNCHY